MCCSCSMQHKSMKIVAGGIQHWRIYGLLPDGLEIKPPDTQQGQRYLHTYTTVNGHWCTADQTSTRHAPNAAHSCAAETMSQLYSAACIYTARAACFQRRHWHLHRPKLACVKKGIVSSRCRYRYPTPRCPGPSPPAQRTHEPPGAPLPPGHTTRRSSQATPPHALAGMQDDSTLQETTGALAHWRLPAGRRTSFRVVSTE